MSWQAYVDDYLLAELPNGATLSHAAIIGHDGSEWAKSPNFPEFSDAEWDVVMKGFGDQSVLTSGGVKIAGEKYMFIMSDGSNIRCRAGKNGGLTLHKTAQAVLLGIYQEPAQSGDVEVAVAKVADYLRESGY
mmetsp:Transcript_28879/g.81335  ORF Transcript_28879/g.81335 Transcript_28879/m.81335 type:complete len:133 (+) Transcript_28879:244-642(+)